MRFGSKIGVLFLGIVCSLIDKVFVVSIFAWLVFNEIHDFFFFCCFVNVIHCEVVRRASVRIDTGCFFYSIFECVDYEDFFIISSIVYYSVFFL